MNGIFAIYAVALVFAWAGLLMAPFLAPRRFFFTVTVEPGFADSAEGRAILRGYRVGVGFVIVIAAVAAALGTLFGNTAPLIAAVFIPIVAGMSVFLAARAKASRFSAPMETVHEANLDEGGDRLPRWSILALPPFAIPVAAALYLNAHWTEIPERFPIHWDGLGHPNRWVEKSVHSVYGPIWYGAGMLLMLAMISLAAFYGARRAAQRTATLAIMIGSMYVMGLMFGAIAVMPAMHFSIWVFIAPTGAFAVAMLVWSYRFLRDPNRKGEATPDACWYLGQIYHNPADPALFVQKRLGLGYTLNFGNRVSWVIMGVLFVSIAGLTLALP